MRLPLTLTALLASSVLSSASVFAAPDERMACRMLSVKVNDPRGMGVKFVCKAPLTRGGASAGVHSVASNDADGFPALSTELIDAFTLPLT